MLRNPFARQFTVPADTSVVDTPGDRTAATRRRAFSLRARLLALIALVLLPCLGLVLYTQADERKAAIATISNDATLLIRIASSNQAAQIEAVRHLLVAFAQLPQLHSDDAAACNAFLADMLGAYPLYFNIGVADSHGNLRCSAVPMPSPVNVGDRPYFKRALETRRFAIGDYQIGRITGLPSINYAYPIVDAAGRVEAVVFVAQSLGWLTSALANVQFAQGTTLVMTDGSGIVLARIPADIVSVGKPMPERALFAATLRGKQGSVVEADDAQGLRRLWTHAPLMEGLGLHAIMGVPRSVAFADVDRRLFRNLVTLGLVTALAIGAAWFGSEFFILRQIDTLVLATRTLASGDLGARARVVGGRGSELEFLAHAFNTMAATLEARDRDLRIAEEKTRAVQIELAVSQAEMDIAREIQRSLLPEDPLTLPGVHFAGRCIPAVAVGGDYFGYFPRGHDGIDTFISDVSGHGVGAALLMAEARTMFLAERLVALSAAPILARLNDLLYDDLDRARLFMTACCATFDARTRVLSYANAGHPPALWLPAREGTWRLLQASGMLLGMDKTVQFTDTRVILDAGDIVVFYTDGITETGNETGALFGIERLGDVVVAHRENEPEALIAAVLATLDRFAGFRAHDDDVTIVVMKVTA